MRRLTRRDDDGVIAITVTILAALLFVMAAFSVDIGSAVAVTRSAQNSADAAALSVAVDCARGAGASSITSYLTNGQTGSTTGCGGGTVTATVSRTKDWTFGKLVGLGSYTKTRQATAKWGALGSGVGPFPIVIAACGIINQPLSTTVTLYSDDVIGCGTGPGQFGLVQDGCTLTGTAVAGQSLPAASGNAFATKTGCSIAEFNTRFLNKDVLVPVWDSHAPGSYHIAYYAVFHLTAWSANGNASSTVPFVFDGTHALDNPNPKKCPVQAGHVDGSGACIQGQIKSYTTQSGTVVPGVACATNHLACLVYLEK